MLRRAPRTTRGGIGPGWCHEPGRMLRNEPGPMSRRHEPGPMLVIGPDLRAEPGRMAIGCWTKDPFSTSDTLSYYNCIIAPTLPNCSDFETTKMQFRKYMSTKQVNVLNSSLRFSMFTYMIAWPIALQRCCFSFPSSSLSYSVSWLSLWFAIAICNIFPYISYICLFADYLSLNNIAFYKSFTIAKGSGTSGLNAC
jgi:hypothetical protein